MQQIDFLFFAISGIVSLCLNITLHGSYPNICINCQLPLVFSFLKLNPRFILTMKSWEVEGLSIDDKYEIEEFRVIMKDFADAATEGNLEEVLELDSELREPEP